MRDYLNEGGKLLYTGKNAAAGALATRSPTTRPAQPAVLRAPTPAT